jgi:hypothetical protein
MTYAEPYLGNDQLHVGVAKGLVISNTTTYNILRTPKWVFTLSNILQVLQIKNDSYLFNNSAVKTIFFEFHSSVFYVKDLITKAILLSGQSKDGFYVLSKSYAIFLPQVFLFASLSTSADVWHYWLGHPSSWVLSLLASNKRSLVRLIL